MGLIAFIVVLFNQILTPHINLLIEIKSFNFKVMEPLERFEQNLFSTRITSSKHHS